MSFLSAVSRNVVSERDSLVCLRASVRKDATYPIQEAESPLYSWGEITVQLRRPKDWRMNEERSHT